MKNTPIPTLRHLPNHMLSHYSKSALHIHYLYSYINFNHVSAVLTINKSHQTLIMLFHILFHPLSIPACILKSEYTLLSPLPMLLNIKAHLVHNILLNKPAFHLRVHNHISNFPNLSVTLNINSCHSSFISLILYLHSMTFTLIHQSCFN